MHGRTKKTRAGAIVEARSGRHATSVAMLCLTLVGAGVLATVYAHGARADEQSVPSYATERLLATTGHAPVKEVGLEAMMAEVSSLEAKPAPVAEAALAQPVAEGRAQRLQRVLKEDGETAARLAPVILGFKGDLPDAVAYDIALAIAREARQHSLRPELVAAVIKAESNYNLHCVSHTNDHGLMQLHGDRVYDIKENIALGCRELATWRATYQCGEREMLAHYNGGCNPPGVSWSYADKVLGLARGAGSAQ